MSTRPRSLARLRWVGAFAAAAFVVAAALLVRAMGFPPNAVPRDTALPGATLEQIDAANGPALVVTSVKSGNAGSTGLKVGDRIDRIDRLPVHSNRALRREIRHATGRAVEIQVWRDGHPAWISMARHTGG